MKKFHKSIDKLSDWLLVSLAVIILFATIIDGIHLIIGLKFLFIENKIEISTLFAEYLGNALSLVIGIEFVKMLVHRSPDLVIEVLVYAIARGMVIFHPRPLEILVQIGAIGILFAIRKFLLIKGVDISPENIPVEEIEQTEKLLREYYQKKEQELQNQNIEKFNNLKLSLFKKQHKKILKTDYKKGMDK